MKLFQTRVDLLIAKCREIYREENSKKKLYRKKKQNNNNDDDERVKRVGKNMIRKIERLLEKAKTYHHKINQNS